MAELLDLIDQLIGADADGRLSGGGPDLYVFRAPDTVVCRCHERLGDEIVGRLEAIAHAPRGRPRDWARDYARYLAVLAEAGLPSAIRAGPLYRADASPPGGDAAVEITPANSDLLRGGLDEWLPDVANGRPMWAMVVDGRAVALCASVSARGGAHAAGVETLPEFRGRGLGSHAVAAWARAVLASGDQPFYATTFDNLASQNLARRLGLTLIGSEFSVTCER